MNNGVLIEKSSRPNDERSHAGPVMPNTPQDELPALADATGSALSSMEFNFPIFERRLNAKSRIAIRTQVIGRPLLSVLQICNLSLLIHLKDIREDRIRLLDGAWLFPVEIQVRNTFEQVMRSAREKIRERP
jgi:hypothetical protein